MACNFWNDFVNHKEKNNSTPLMYDIIARSIPFFFNVSNGVLLRKAICNVQISLVFTCKEREQLKEVYI